MSDYSIGKDIQELLYRIGQLESKVDALVRRGFEAVEPFGISSEAVAGQVSLAAKAGELSGVLNELWDQPIRILASPYDLYENGGWHVTCPTRNESRHSNWWVYHFLQIRNAEGTQVLHEWATWDGRFGAGYSETKERRGEIWAVRQYWHDQKTGKPPALPG